MNQITITPVHAGVIRVCREDLYHKGEEKLR